MTRLLVLGLDGATWNLLKPLIDQGKLPTFGQLIKNGCYGDLETCIPPVTFPAWKCYSTGKNPGKLGVYWWMNLDIKSKKVIINNSQSFKSKEIWDYLSIKGIKCGIVGMPTTYPPKKVNGFMISEFNPSNTNFAYPKELENELKSKFGFVAEFSEYHGDDKEQMIKDRLTLIKQRFDAAKYLIKKFNPEFIQLTIFHIDNIQHFYWKYWEKKDPRLGKVLEDTWRFIDNELRILIHEFKPDYIIVMSDHGFVHLKAIFNIEMWLLNKGYLILKSKLLMLLSKAKLLPIVALLAKETLLKIIKIKKRDLTEISVDTIDWDKSKVIPLGEGLLYINKEAFETFFDYCTFYEKLINELLEIKNPKTGETIIQRVYRKEEIYKGEYVDLAPDLILLPNEGYEILCSLSKKIWEFSPKEEGWTATHKLHGILIVYGQSIKKGYEIKGARIYDIAPTILHIFELAIPNDMDGRVLTEIFESDSMLIKRKPIYVNQSHYRENYKIKLKNKIKKIKLKMKR